MPGECRLRYPDNAVMSAGAHDVSKAKDVRIAAHMAVVNLDTAPNAHAPVEGAR